MSKPGRKALAIPTVSLRVYIPEDLYAQLSLLTFDPLRQKPKYGAASEIVEQALREHFAKLRANAEK